MRGRRQAHNPTLAKIMGLAYTRRYSHSRPQTPACHGVYSTCLIDHTPRPRQVSMSSKRSKTVPSFSAFRGSIVQEKMADRPGKNFGVKSIRLKKRSVERVTTHCLPFFGRSLGVLGVCLNYFFNQNCFPRPQTSSLSSPLQRSC